MTWDPAQGGVMFVAANAGSLVAGSPLLTYADPNADGASPNNAWTKSAGTSGWSLLDDAVRQPTAPATGTDRVTSSTDEQTQELVFPNTLLYDATATYTLRIYGSAGSKRALDVQVSTNDGASWQTRQANVIGAGSGSSWRSIDVTSLAASQAALDGLRVRLICNQTATGGGAGSVEVDEVYVDGSLPTWTTSLVDPAFGVNSGAKFEAGAWAVGNFASTGTAELGGSVYVQDGTAKIAGGGSLKAFLSLPSGAPELYSIENGATEFG
jgi:hypothetical protein